MGTVRGQPTSLDIHNKVAIGDTFSYVRITDAKSHKSGHPYAGADIDAVGAIGAEERDCLDYCKEKFDKKYEHGMWDGVSDWPYCGCICEKGWEMTEAGCVACEDICKE